MPNPGPASTITEHPLGGGSGPYYIGSSNAQTSSASIGFYQDPYGGGAVPQRQSAFQQIITVSQTAGLLVNYQSNSQSLPAITADNISAIQVTFTGAPMVSSADLVIVNKSTPIAGFGIASVRVSTSSPQQNNAIFILGSANFNVSGVSSVTPAGDRYLFTAIRGSVVSSVTLTPAVVPANTTLEQQFTVTGVAPGMVVPVSKPTEQSGLGLGGTRVVANNVLGITFVNTGNTAITPTASEVYSFAGLAGAAAISPYMTVGLGMSQATATTLTVTGGNGVGTTVVTVTGVQTADQVVSVGQGTLPLLTGVAPQTAQVSAAVANVIALNFASTVSTGTTTASSTDTYLIPMLRSNLEAPMTIYPATVASAVVGPNTTTEIGVTVTGITVSTAIYVSKPTFTTGIAIVGYRVSAAATAGSTIGITFGNPTNASITIPSETYLVGSFKPLFGAGHYVEQMVGPLSVQNVYLTNEMRAALAGTQFIQGF